MSLNTLQAVSLAADILTAVTELTLRLQTVSALLQKARLENRDLTDAELRSVVALDDDAKVKLDVALAKAMAGA